MPGQQKQLSSNRPVLYILQTLAILAIGLAGCTCSAVLANASSDPKQQTATVLTSPNEQLVLHFAVEPGAGKGAQVGKLVYSVFFRNKQVLEASSLGLELAGQSPLGQNIQIIGSDAGSGVDSYELSNSKVSNVHDIYNSLALHVSEASGLHRIMTIEARAYNDGIAFRYVLPTQDAIHELQIQQEDTEFRLSTDATDWALELPNYRSSYESEYVKLQTSSFSNQGGVPSSFLIGLPLLMHEPGTAWLALMEADLEGSAGMYVTNPSGTWEGHWFASRLAPRFDNPELAIKQTLPYHSAWRVLMIADDPGRFIESSLIYDLNPPNRIADASWIKPGKASWNWWVNDVDKNGVSAYTTENMKYYVDFAAQSGFPYMMLDAGWTAGTSVTDGSDITKMNGKVDIPELVRYAAAKHVKVWIWVYSGSLKKQMKEAFPLYEQWGVAGVKIDFISRDDQEGIQFYYDVAREGAQHHLLIDFHGTRTPWGIQRTYPNVLSYEGVLGMENNKAGRRDSPVDRSVFPFTRMLAGPMDYTPGGFRNATEDSFVGRYENPMVMGTRAQQLALYVVFETPFPMISDSPQTYANEPAFQFIKDVPVSWDSTHVLNGEPGEFVTIARQHGDEWDLGSMTNWTPRTLEVPLGFLASKRVYTAEIYEDADDAALEPTHVKIHKQIVSGTDTLTLKLAPGGGCAIRFVPQGGK